MLQLLQENSASLDKPSPNLTNFYLMAQKILENQWQQVGSKVGIKAIISNLLNGLLDWLTSVREKRVRQTRQVKLSNKAKEVEDDLGLEEISSADWHLLTGLQGEFYLT